MAIRAFEPMGVGQILDRTFSLYREKFVRFIAIVAVVTVPVALLSFAVTFVTARAGAGGPEAASAAVAARLLAGLPVLFLSIVAQNLCRAALIKSVSGSYLGGDVGVGEAYKAVLPRLWTVIWASILVGVVVVIGLVLCVVPGVIFSLWLAVTTPAIIIENLKATEGMGRSKALASGNLGRIFAVGLVVVLIAIIIGLVLGALGGVIGKTLFSEAPMAAAFVHQLFSLVAQVLAIPISATAFILVYYDLRIRKEGFDLEMLAKSLAPGETPPAGRNPAA